MLSSKSDLQVRGESHHRSSALFLNKKISSRVSATWTTLTDILSQIKRVCVCVCEMLSTWNRTSNQRVLRAKDLLSHFSLLKKKKNNHLY